MKAPQDTLSLLLSQKRAWRASPPRSTPSRLLADANKIEIAKAIESLFPGTKVAKVNTMNVAGKAKRMGMNQGYRSDWKQGHRNSRRGIQWHRVLRDDAVRGRVNKYAASMGLAHNPAN